MTDKKNPYLIAYKAMIKAIPHYHSVKQVRATMEAKADYYERMAEDLTYQNLKDWAKSVARAARAIQVETLIVDTIEDLVLNCEIAAARYELLLV